jgi:AcrR family transcriptional regulator
MFHRVTVKPDPDATKEKPLMTVDERLLTDPRQRILDASYDLFVKRGIQAVGVKEIISTAEVTEAAFYDHFPTKRDLVMVFLERRHELFTVGYLGAEARKRGTSPQDRLLAIFDIFDEWFQDEQFKGCPYIRALVEFGMGHDIGQASAGYLREARHEARNTAAAMGLIAPEDFAECWMILLQGSVIAAMGTGYTSPRRVRKLGELLIATHTPKGVTL